jgi:hypothetical protein
MGLAASCAQRKRRLSPPDFVFLIPISILPSWMVSLRQLLGFILNDYPFDLG